MELNKGIAVEAGRVVGTVFGGPYVKYRKGTRRLIGIKMAAEINHPHEVSVPTEDFSVPNPTDLSNGIKAAFDAMANGKDVYVGCMGGVGRTGLFMSVLVKAVNEYKGLTGDPIMHVRKHYNMHAVETQGQRNYVTTFDVTPLIKHLKDLNPTETVGWLAHFRKFWGV